MRVQVGVERRTLNVERGKVEGEKVGLVTGEDGRRKVGTSPTLEVFAMDCTLERHLAGRTIHAPRWMPGDLKGLAEG